MTKDELIELKKHRAHLTTSLDDYKRRIYLENLFIDERLERAIKEAMPTIYCSTREGERVSHDRSGLCYECLEMAWEENKTIQESEEE